MIPRRIAAVLVGAVLLQLTLFAQFSYEGARPEVIVLVVLAVGYLVGPDEGAIVGFAGGLAFDVHLTTPLGLTALVYLLAGFAIGRIVPGTTDGPWWLTSLVLAAGSAVTMVVYGFVGEIVGLDTLHGPAIGTIAVFVALVNLVFAPLAIRLVRWTRYGSRSRRRHSVYA